MTQVTIIAQQSQVVVGEETLETVVSPLTPTKLEIWQPGMAPGGKTNDILVKSSDQDYDSEWTDQPIVDKLRFDLNAQETVATGEFAWNTDEGTVELGKLGNVVNYVGQETMLLCRNSTASAIPIGTAVRFAGSLGNSGRLLVAPMIANGTLPGYVFFGVTKESIAAGADGYVTTFGKIKGVDTRAWPDGTVLWCSPATPGGFTSTEPLAPNLKLAVAAVLNSAANGTLMVRWDTGRRLQDLHDVEANGSKVNGDTLEWKAANNRWQATNRLTLLEQRVAALEAIVSP